MRRKILIEEQTDCWEAKVFLYISHPLMGEHGMELGKAKANTLPELLEDIKYNRFKSEIATFTETEICK